MTPDHANEVLAKAIRNFLHRDVKVTGETKNKMKTNKNPNKETSQF